MKSMPVFIPVLCLIAAVSGYDIPSSGYGVNPGFPPMAPNKGPERPPAPLPTYGAPPQVQAVPPPLPTASPPKPLPALTPPPPAPVPLPPSPGVPTQPQGLGHHILLVSPETVNPNLVGYGTLGMPPVAPATGPGPLSWAFQPYDSQRRQNPLMLLLMPQGAQNLPVTLGSFGINQQQQVQLQNGAGLVGNQLGPQWAEASKLKLKAPARPGRPASLVSLLRPMSLQPLPPVTFKGLSMLDAQCNFDPSCWAFQPESAIQDGVMYHRLTGVTCEKCLEACKSDISEEKGPYVCRAVTYDHKWRICDLFAVSGGEAPHYIRRYPGRAYFRPVGKCAANLPPVPGPVDSRKFRLKLVQPVIHNLLMPPISRVFRPPAGKIHQPITSEIAKSGSANEGMSPKELMDMAGIPPAELPPLPIDEDSVEDISVPSESEQEDIDVDSAIDALLEAESAGEDVGELEYGGDEVHVDSAIDAILLADSSAEDVGRSVMALEAEASLDPERSSNDGETSAVLETSERAEDYDGENVSFGICVAVRDIGGRKRCPHGIIHFIDGSSRYCEDPVDCDS